MVWHIIRANIFSARIFPRPCGARKNTSQIAKYPHVLYAKPSNKVYIFCVLRCIFPSPAGARKNTSNEQNVRSYYMLNHRIGGLLFHYKKKLPGNWLLFFGKSIQRHPDSVCEDDVNN